MKDDQLRVRANPSTGELEIEGPAEAVAEWWERLWPQLSDSVRSGAKGTDVAVAENPLLRQSQPFGGLPSVFGEFFAEFRSDVSDVDKVLIAAAFVQCNDTDRTFVTKAANQLLLDQNVRVANASENVRRLVQTKRAFVVSGGRFRVSTNGFEYLKSLKAKL